MTVAIPEMVSGHSLDPISDFIMAWILASNSFWNPIIYMLTMPSFNIALRHVITDFTRCVSGRTVKMVTSGRGRSPVTKM